MSTEMGNESKAIGWCAKHNILIGRRKLREKCRNREKDGRICAFFNYEIPNDPDRHAAIKRKKRMETME